MSYMLVTNLSCQVNPYLAEGRKVDMLVLQLGYQQQPPTTLLCTAVLVVQVCQVLPQDFFPVALQMRVKKQIRSLLILQWYNYNLDLTHKRRFLLAQQFLVVFN